jgi:hypothetical protein
MREDCWEMENGNWEQKDEKRAETRQKRSQKSAYERMRETKYPRISRLQMLVFISFIFSLILHESFFRG